MCFQNNSMKAYSFRNDCIIRERIVYRYRIAYLLLLIAFIDRASAFSVFLSKTSHLRNQYSAHSNYNTIAVLNNPTTNFAHIHRFRSDTKLKSFTSESTEGTTDEDNEFEAPSLKENEEFIAAVTEVKAAAKNVTESTVALTSTIVKKGPDIIGMLLSALLSKELRYVCGRFTRFPISRMKHNSNFFLCLHL